MQRPSRLRRVALAAATVLLVTPLSGVDASALLGGDGPPRMTAAFAAGLEERPDDEAYGAFVHFRPRVLDAEQLAVLEQRELHVTKSYPRFDAHYVVGVNPAYRLMAGDTRVAFLEDDAPITFFSDTARDATRVTSVQADPVADRHDAGRLVGSLGGSPFRDGQGRILDGTGVGVAIVDSGVDGTHPDLAARLSGNVKVVCPAPVLVHGDGDDRAGLCYQTQYVSAPDTDTSSGHGTHVAGTVAGDGTASEGLYRGVAPGASLYGIGTGEGISVLYAAEAYDLVLRHHATSTPPIRVVNNSWGCAGGCEFEPDRLVNKMVTQAAAEGVVSVFAVGNDGGDGTTDRVSGYAKNPAPGVIAVANYDDGGTGTRDGTIWSSSSRAQANEPEEFPDLAAPGRSITSTCNHDKPLCNAGPAVAWEPWYALMTGTSMATPHVAGAVALLLQADPSLTPTEVEALLEASAHELSSGAPYVVDPAHPDGLTSLDKGHGLLDARAAVEALGLEADGYPLDDPFVEITSPVAGTSVVDQVTVTGVARHGIHETGEVELAGADGGDEPEGLLDLTSLSVTDAGDDLHFTVGLRDLADRHAAANRPQLTVFGALDGRAFGASAYLDDGTARDDGNATFASAVPSAVVTAGSTVTLVIPESQLGSPGADAVLSNVRVATYRGAVRDVAPGGTTGDFVARPRFARRLAVNQTPPSDVPAAVQVWASSQSGPGPVTTVDLDTEPHVDEPWTVDLDLTGFSGTVEVHALLLLGGRARAADATSVEAFATAQPPSQPSDWTYDVLPGPEVTVAWAPPASDGGAPITGYRIERDGAVIADLGPDARAFTDDTVVEGHRYDFALYAVNVVGSSPAAAWPVDLTDPEPGIPAITSPSPGDFVGGSVVVTGTGEPGTAIEVLEGEAIVARAPVGEDGTWAAGYQATSGPHTIVARAYTQHRTGAPSAPVSFTVDGAPAQVTFTTSNGRTFVGVETVRIEGAAVDDAGVAEVTLGYRHGHAGPFDSVSTPVCAGCGSTEATFFDEPVLAPGYYDVFAVVTDVAGNRSVARIGVYVVAASARPPLGPAGSVGPLG